MSTLEKGTAPAEGAAQAESAQKGDGNTLDSTASRGGDQAQGEATLLACPFCGRSARLVSQKVEVALLWKVACSRLSACPCAHSYSWHKTEEAAVQAWNTRLAPGADDLYFCIARPARLAAVA